MGRQGSRRGTLARMRLAVAALVILALQLTGAPAVQTQSPEIDELRRRVAAYTRRFITQFSNVVTEEEYDQRFTISTRRRRLTSEVLLSFQRTLPPSSCPFILEISLARGCTPELAHAACGPMAGEGTGAGSSGG